MEINARLQGHEADGGSLLCKIETSAAAFKAQRNQLRVKQVECHVSLSAGNSNGFLLYQLVMQCMAFSNIRIGQQSPLVLQRFKCNHCNDA